jgi:transposase-like protein
MLVVSAWGYFCVSEIPTGSVIPFSAFPAHIWWVIYTTNSIENLSLWLRKVIKTRGTSLGTFAYTKLICLTSRNKLKSAQKRPSIIGRLLAAGYVVVMS